TTSTEILESQLQEKKNILEEKNKEYEELKEKIKIELKEFEKSKTMTIMADLYKIIKELAEEENISIVVEKGNILYGLPNIDITDKVIERLRGKQ
ncbi:MAG: OmpH family outer membrane protein, partial [Endomicrobiia bacterium]